MLAVEIDFLTGHYGATKFNDRGYPEWPPHPTRLFAAMVATWADVDGVDDAPSRAALEWFEALAPPIISCSQAYARVQTTSYVPVNDAGVVRDLSSIYARYQAATTALGEATRSGDAKATARAERELAKAGMKVQSDSSSATTAKANETASTVQSGLRLLPELRGRQGRIYPSVVPDDPHVVFAWPDAEPSIDVRSALEKILARVHRIGHSSTLVSCRIVDRLPEATLVPREDGPEQIRVPGPGVLREMEETYRASINGSEPRRMPTRFASFGRPVPGGTPQTSALAGDWVVLTLKKRFPVRRTSELTAAVRGALLAHAVEPVPELISGHPLASKHDRPHVSDREHLAVLTLPFTGRRHADGSIQGMALVVPRSASIDDRRALFVALDAWEDSSPAPGQLPLHLGRGGRVLLDHLTGPVEQAVLRESYWCAPTTEWSSVTPVALDRHPGDLRDKNADRRAQTEQKATAAVAAACVYVGLPTPESVEVDKDSFLTAVPSASQFPAFRSGSGPVRALVHVRLRFGIPVGGPVVLGAGRYRGLGLCMPVREGVQS